MPAYSWSGPTTGTPRMGWLHTYSSKRQRLTYPRRGGGRRFVRRAGQRRGPYIPKVELKVIRTLFVTDPNSTGVTTLMTPIAQGLDISNRIGRQITIRRIVIRGNVVANATPASTQVRFMLVRDNYGTTSAPAIANAFFSVFEFFNNQPRLGDSQNQARFTVLWDWFAITSSATNAEGVWFHKDIRLNSRTQFTGTAAGDEGKGALYLFQASSETTNDPVVNATVQVTFTDS